MSVKLRKRKLKSGRVSLYLDIYSSGQRHYDFLRLYLDGNRQANKETLQLAESIRAKRQLELQSQRHGFAAPFKRKADFVRFFADLAATKGEKDTAWRNTLQYLRRFTGGSVRFDAVNEPWLEALKVHLLENLAQNTARLYLAKVKAALNYAVRHKIIPVNPFSYVENIKHIESERTYLTVDELRLLAQTHCRNAEVRRAFLFACFTGLRVSDIRALTWNQIRGERLHFRQQKTSGQEYMPLSVSAQHLLGETGKPDSPIFRLPGAQNSVNDIIAAWVLEADIDKHVTFHVSRHTFATMALSHDIHLYTVSKLLGHKDIATTQIYAKIIDKKKQEAVNRLPEIEL